MVAQVIAQLRKKPLLSEVLLSEKHLSPETADIRGTNRTEHGLFPSFSLSYVPFVYPEPPPVSRCVKIDRMPAL